MNPRYFVRITHAKTKQGVWYDFDGNFTGLIHTKYSFCKSSNLQMPYCEDTVGWISATETIGELLEWFPLKDIRRLQIYGYEVALFESTLYKYKGTHWLLSKKDSKRIGKVIIRRR
jgi:hypothetical protein